MSAIGWLAWGQGTGSDTDWVWSPPSWHGCFLSGEKRPLHPLLWMALAKCWLVVWALLFPDAMFPIPSDSHVPAPCSFVIGRSSILPPCSTFSGLLARCLWGGCGVESHPIHGVEFLVSQMGLLSDLCLMPHGFCFVFYETDFWLKTLTHFTFK